MPGVNPAQICTHILIISDDAERFRSALMLALTQQALGHDVRIFLQIDAVPIINRPITAPKDPQHQQAGLPSLAALLAEVMESDISVYACQSGLDLALINASTIDERIKMSGLVSFMAGIKPEDRLLTI